MKIKLLELNLVLEGGISETVALQVIDETTGLPINISEWDVNMQVRDKIGGVNVYATKTKGNGITVPIGSGWVYIAFTPESTQYGGNNFWIGNAFYDVILTDGDSKKWKLATGIISINQPVILS